MSGSEYRSGLAGRIVLYGCATAILAFLVLPILIIIPLSFSADQYLTFPPSGWSLQWYERFFGRPEWMAALRLSLEVAVMSTTLTVVLGVLTSFALVRGHFRGKGIIYAILLSPMIVPTIITAVAVYLFFAKLQMLGSPVAMALGHTILALPLMVIILSATLQGFDRRLEQAAASLGAGPLTTFRRVTLPIISPGVISGALFSFLSSFDELVVPLLLSGPTSRTLPVQIWNSIFLQVEPTIAAVSSFLIILAVVILVAAGLAQRLRH